MEQAYILRFFFDPGSGICVWAGNVLTREKFGYPIRLDDLPISEDLVIEGNEIIEFYDTSIDWHYPPNPTLWNEATCQVFNSRVEDFIIKLQQHLPDNFMVFNQFAHIHSSR